MARGCLSAGPLLLLATGGGALGSGGAAGSTLIFGPVPWRENRLGYSFKKLTILPALRGPYTSVVSWNPRIPRNMCATLANVYPVLGSRSFKFLA